MSVWKRDLFKWVRPESAQSDTMAEAKPQKTVHPLVTLGEIDPKNDQLKMLHLAAINGSKKQLVDVLKRGMWIDYPNSSGQTALFVATLRGQYGITDYLLQHGANPNEKSDTGMTPLHVACLRANLHCVGAMLAAGGDLRLHDNEGNSCLDWAMMHPSARRRKRVVEFLQKSQLFALSYAGDSLGRGHGLERQPSILQMLRSKVGSQMSLDLGQDTGLRRVESHGYGRVYLEGDTVEGIVSIVPLIAERHLLHDKDGVTFRSSCHFVMSSMLWNKTPVTVKRPDKHLVRETILDLLIMEMEHISRLRHPNLLLLMGLCQSSAFDNVMLVFERVYIGSVYHVIHEKKDHMPMTYIRDVMSQVCQALLYLHAQGYIHCSLTSHGVFMVSMYQAKVGNLEFMVELKKAATGRPCSLVTGGLDEDFFRWMAPEVLLGSAPSFNSDIYSVCCILYEMITLEVPWSHTTRAELVGLHTSGKAVLTVPSTVTLFQEVISQGLSADPQKRQQDMEKLFIQLQCPLDKPVAWKTKDSLHKMLSLHKESSERISLSGSTTRPFGHLREDQIKRTSSTQISPTSSTQLTGKNSDNAV